jgi:hypothetical protein
MVTPPVAPPSVLGRLLVEVSWGGNPVAYRRGGRGLENVLTAEVFQALEFLPRTAFLGRVLAGVRQALAVTRRLTGEVEEAAFTMLPGDYFVVEKGTPGRRALWVQPDGVLESRGVFCMIEAKRIKPGSFQPEQLAREYLAVLKEAAARGKMPLLLLVLPEAPPVKVSVPGAHARRLEIADAISERLDDLLERVGHPSWTASGLITGIDSTIAWTTWTDIKDVVSDAGRGFEASDPSVQRAVRRVAANLVKAIKWHQDGANLPAEARRPIAPICLTCVHMARDAWPGGFCEAYPNGISEGILENRLDHRRPLEGDQGVQWAQDPSSPRLDAEFYDKLFAQVGEGVRPTAGG